MMNKLRNSQKIMNPNSCTTDGSPKSMATQRGL
jgi:hypothetical protein